MPKTFRTSPAAAVAGIATAVLNSSALAAIAGGRVLQNVNFAAKADIACDYLAGIHVSLTESADGSPLLDPSRVAEMARTFTVKVECWR